MNIPTIEPLSAGLGAIVAFVGIGIGELLFRKKKRKFHPDFRALTEEMHQDLQSFNKKLAEMHKFYVELEEGK